MQFQANCIKIPHCSSIFPPSDPVCSLVKKLAQLFQENLLHPAYNTFVEETVKRNTSGNGTLIIDLTLKIKSGWNYLSDTGAWT